MDISFRYHKKINICNLVRGDFPENASQFLIFLRRRIRAVQLLPDSQIVGAQQEVQDALHRSETALRPDA